MFPVSLESGVNEKEEKQNTTVSVTPLVKHRNYKKRNRQIVQCLLNCLNNNTFPTILQWTKVKGKFWILLRHKRSPYWSETDLAFFKELDQLSSEKFERYKSRPEYKTDCKIRCKANLRKLCRDKVLKYIKQIKVDRSTYKIFYQFVDLPMANLESAKAAQTGEILEMVKNIKVEAVDTPEESSNTIVVAAGTNEVSTSTNVVAVGKPAMSTNTIVVAAGTPIVFENAILVAVDTPVVSKNANVEAVNVPEVYEKMIPTIIEDTCKIPQKVIKRNIRDLLDISTETKIDNDPYLNANEGKCLSSTGVQTDLTMSIIKDGKASETVEMEVENTLHDMVKNIKVEVENIFQEKEIKKEKDENAAAIENILEEKEIKKEKDEIEDTCKVPEKAVKEVPIDLDESDDVEDMEVDDNLNTYKEKPISSTDVQTGIEPMVEDNKDIEIKSPIKNDESVVIENNESVIETKSPKNSDESILEENNEAVKGNENKSMLQENNEEIINDKTKSITKIDEPLVQENNEDIISDKNKSITKDESTAQENNEDIKNNTNESLTKDDKPMVQENNKATKDYENKSITKGDEPMVQENNEDDKDNENKSVTKDNEPMETENNELKKVDEVKTSINAREITSGSEIENKSSANASEVKLLVKEEDNKLSVKDEDSKLTVKEENKVHLNEEDIKSPEDDKKLSIKEEDSKLHVKEENKMQWKEEDIQNPEKENKNVNEDNGTRRSDKTGKDYIVLKVDGEDENTDEKYVNMMEEEVKEYLVNKIGYYMTSTMNPLYALHQKANEIKKTVAEQEDEFSKLYKGFKILERKHDIFLRKTGVVPKIPVAHVSVDANLPVQFVPKPECLTRNELSITKVNTPTPKPKSQTPAKPAAADIECIDLTDDSEPLPSTSAISKKTNYPVISLKHPAPLPPRPFSVNVNTTPPKPKLKIFSEDRGIVLQWEMPPLPLNRSKEQIASFEIYGYQETNNIPINTLLWKKIGLVKAMTLPMACTLTQFVDGNKYHFAIRALDVHGNYGHFSDAISIVYTAKKK